MKLGYAISEIRKHGTDRHWWRQRFLARIVSTYYSFHNPVDSTPLIQQDWDNVILLDACRYDLFEAALREFDLPGTLGKRNSVESATPYFLEENFGGGQFHDIVYVTANPYVDTKLPSDTFHAVDSVWKDGWDDGLSTVLPSTMAARALAAADTYPDKRLIVHYNQPHAPFVGEVSLGDRGVMGIRQEALGNDQPGPDERPKTPFELLESGQVSKEEVWEAYLSNLEFALPSVRRLLQKLEGKTVVTSDHGNGLGERAKPFPIRVYGHPGGILIPALTDVPWHVSQNGDRKGVVRESPAETIEAGETSTKTTKERLRALGYVE